MLKKFIFYLFICNLSLLSACSQVYSRFIDDSSTLFDKLENNSSNTQSAKEDIINNLPIVAVEPSSRDTSSNTDSVINYKDKISSNQNPTNKSNNSNSKVSVPVSVLADDYKKEISSEVISNQPKTVDLSESVNIYDKSNSNQVILRNGDVIIDFSNDMPVINSRNSFEFKSP
jgi:hypothetical protein